MIVTLQEAKDHLNVTFDDDDVLIQSKVDAAEDHVSRLLGFDLADMSPLPESLRQAVLQVAAHFYTNREAVLVGVSAHDLPLGVWDLISSYRQYWSDPDG